MNDSYSYSGRKGVRPISWEDFHSLSKGLALAASKFNPEVILGIARGGMYPGTLISHILQKEFFPIRLSRRVNDLVESEHPVWLVKPPSEVEGKKVLIVDEICDSGETLKMVTEEVLKMGAKDVKTAVLYSHKKGESVPDYIGVITDELVMNPWDREVLKDGRFVFHPEYAGALAKQNIDADPELLLKVEVSTIAKG